MFRDALRAAPGAASVPSNALRQHFFEKPRQCEILEKQAAAAKARHETFPRERTIRLFAKD